MNKCNFLQLFIQINVTLRGILSSFYFIFSIELEAPGLDTQIAHALGATPIKSYIAK